MFWDTLAGLTSYVLETAAEIGGLHHVCNFGYMSPSEKL